MNKIKLPFLTPKAFTQTARELVQYLKSPTDKVGAPPGTLTYTGQHDIPTEIKLHHFDQEQFETSTIQNIDQLREKKLARKNNWIEVIGVKDIETIRTIGEIFGIDPLTLEDLLNVGQLPKIEELKDYLYITLKIVDFDTNEKKFNISHFSIIAFENVLLTFSETPHLLFDKLEMALKKTGSKLRTSSLNYLGYRMIDTIVDHYYFGLEWLSDTLGELEIELVEAPHKKHINTILTFKKKWLVLRKSIYPLRDEIKKRLHTEPVFVKSAGKKYINDVNDHLQSIFENMEIIRETLNNLMDLYNSTVSNKMNEVMQVLTIVSTIFIPLTFIAGIYGMNFENMPELSWENGYFYTLCFMLIIGIGMTIFMKRRHWF